MRSFSLLLGTTITTLVLLLSCQKAFDPETDIGKKLIQKNDSLLLTFDGKYHKDSIPVNRMYSFIDQTGRALSGVCLSYPFTPLVIGTWSNQENTGYLRFPVDSLVRVIDSIHKTGYTFLNAGIQFTYSRAKSDIGATENLELGLCPSKSDSAYIDTSRLTWISHFALNTNDTNITHIIPVARNHLFDTASITDSVSARTTTTFGRTTRITMKKDTVSIDTIPLKPVTGDTLALDTLPGNLLVIGLLVTGKDTTLIADTIVVHLVSDSIFSPLGLIKKQQKLLSAATRSLTIADTTFQWDTVTTVPETTVTHTLVVKKKVIVNNGATNDTIIIYDTTATSRRIHHDQVHCLGKIFKRRTAIWNLKNSGSDTAMHWYLRAVRSATPRLLLINAINFKVVFERPNASNGKDTVTHLIKPSRVDYTTFELTDQQTLNNACLSSGAAGRFAVIELDLRPFWNIMVDSTSGQPRFRNISKAMISVTPQSLQFHKSRDTLSTVFYMVSANPVSTIEELESSFTNTSPSITISGKTTGINLQIHNYLLSMLASAPALPRTGYLIMKIPSHHFSSLTLKQPASSKIAFEFIVLNTKPASR